VLVLPLKMSIIKEDNVMIGPQGAPSLSHTTIAVVTSFVTALFVNWLSSSANPPFIFIIVGSLLFLGLSVAIEHHLAGARAAPPNIGATVADSFRLTAFSLVLGVVLGAAWLIPIWPTRTFHMFDGYFHNYELGAGAVLALLAILASFRSATAASLVAFILGSTAGMTVPLLLYEGVTISQLALFSRGPSLSVASLA
jgi:hypothetical protein